MDTYTKAILTVIAAALVAHLVLPVVDTRPAHAADALECTFPSTVRVEVTSLPEVAFREPLELSTQYHPLHVKPAP